MALVLAKLGAWADAARLGAASLAFLARAQIVWHPSLTPTHQHVHALFAAAACDAADLARWQREGQALDEAAIETTCLRAVQAAAGL